MKKEVVVWLKDNTWDSKCFYKIRVNIGGHILTNPDTYITAHEADQAANRIAAAIGAKVRCEDG